MAAHAAELVPGGGMTSVLPVVIGDTECYPNFWLACFKRLSDGKVVTLEKSARQELDAARLERIVRSHQVVGFNWRGYDLAMVWAAIRGYSTEQLKRLNDQIIVGRTPWWRVEDLLGFRFPRTDYIDLIEPQPNPIASLKLLNGRLHGPHMQDLPYAPDHVLTPAEMDIVVNYCGNDLDATHRLLDSLREALALRDAITSEIGVDVRSKSDTQMGFAILKKRVEDRTRQRLGKAPNLAGTSFYYHVPDYVKFRTPQLCDLLDRLRTHPFMVLPTGKVDMPSFLKSAKISIGDSVYQMGIGGLHSTEANRTVTSDADHVIYDADVGSYYPALILALGMHPAAMGPEALPVYRGIRNDRMAAKEAMKTEAIAAKKEFLKNKAEGLKIALNGGMFGNTGNPHSAAYAPQILISVTLTGQLCLLMLIEWLEAAGIRAVSGNTDGVTFMCPRDRANLIGKGDRLLPWPEDRDISYGRTLKEITDQWEQATGLDLEFVEYRSLHNISVNSYFAIKPDGKAKRKGTLGNWWAEDDMRGMLMHNPSMTICSDAALAFIRDGTPIEETVKSCTDIRQFVSVTNVRGGGTWRDQYLGKVVRYIWSTDGEPIFYKTPHETTGNFKKVSKTDGARPMMTLQDDLPTDLDYGRYIAEAREILHDVGFFGARPEVAKTRKLRPQQALLWAVAA
jgi:hypothetical protein